MQLRCRPGRQPLKNGQLEVGSRLVKQLERIVSIHVLLIAIATSISSIHEDIGTDSSHMVSHGLGVCLWSAFLVHACTTQLLQQSSFFWVADINHFGSIGFGKMAFYVGRCRTLWHRGNIGINWRWCIGLFAQVRGILQSYNVLDWSVAPEARPSDEMTTQSQSSVFARPLSTRMERGEGKLTDATTLREKDA
jgi:hypothetical protein